MDDGSNADTMGGKTLEDTRSASILSTMSVHVSVDCTAGPRETGKCFAQQRLSIGSMATCFPGRHTTHSWATRGAQE